MSASKPTTIKQFQKRFPDDDVCLDHLMRTRYGQKLVCYGCQTKARFYRVKARRCFECERCGHQVYPTAGTPFERTRTPLTDWFFVMFLFTASRNGVAAKEVQRQIGVTYKTAWRMCHMIRTYMGKVDGDRPLGGIGKAAPIVEIDETYVGSYDKMGQNDKASVLGMVERNGDLVAKQIPDRHGSHVIPQISTWVLQGSRVITDEAKIYQNLGKEGFTHESVNHSAKEYVRDDAHTNSIDSFWSMLKRGINGTYIHISKKHLQKYLWEFEYRHNLRRSPDLMFEILLIAFHRPVQVAARQA
jgi:transposase